MSKKEVYVCDLCQREFQTPLSNHHYGTIDELIKPEAEANGSPNIMLADVEDEINSEGHLHICIHCRLTLAQSIIDDLTLTPELRKRLNAAIKKTWAKAFNEEDQEEGGN